MIFKLNYYAQRFSLRWTHFIIASIVAMPFWFIGAIAGVIIYYKINKNGPDGWIFVTTLTLSIICNVLLFASNAKVVRGRIIYVTIPLASLFSCGLIYIAIGVLVVIG